MEFPEESNHSVDSLIKETLTDTVPPEVEERMRRRLHEFRSRLRLRGIEDSGRISAGPAWVYSVWCKVAFACVSCCILFLFVFIQVSKTRGSLATRIDEIITSTVAIQRNDTSLLRPAPGPGDLFSEVLS